MSKGEGSRGRASGGRRTSRSWRAWDSGFISHKVFAKSFFKSQFPHKSVDLLLLLLIVKDTLKDLWGS